MDNQIVKAKMAFASQQVLAEKYKKELELGLMDADVCLEKATKDCKEEIPQGTNQANMISKLIFAAKKTESLETLAFLLAQISHYFNESTDIEAKNQMATQRLGAKDGGNKGGGKNKRDPKRTRDILSAYDSLTVPKRNRATILAKRFGVTPRTIRNILNEEKEIKRKSN